MAAKLTRGSELAKLMAYHVFGYVYRYELIAVMHCDGMTNKVGRNHTSASPCLYHGLLATFVHSKNLLFQGNSDIRSFF